MVCGQIVRSDGAFRWIEAKAASLHCPPASARTIGVMTRSSGLSSATGSVLRAPDVSASGSIEGAATHSFSGSIQLTYGDTHARGCHQLLG